jgi:hypothetical protein
MTVTVRRALNLYLGLALFGLRMALMVRAQPGLRPWDVLHQGLARKTGLPPTAPEMLDELRRLTTAFAAVRTTA